MSYHGVRNWPPIWTTPRRESKLPKGEVGTLEDVITHELFEHRLYLIMELDDRLYMGSITFDNKAFCETIHAFLQQHLGRLVKEIGDLDVSFTL
jgi:hypothetical protein